MNRTNRTERNLRWAVIVLAAIIVAMVSCSIGTWTGGIIGYLLGRHSMPGASAPRGEMLPYPAAPMPDGLPRPAGGGPWLGVAYRMEEGGALIVEVIPGSPAERAGLRPGDLVTRVDGERVDRAHPLADLVMRHRPGETITLTFERDGERQEVEVTLGDATPPELPFQAPPCPQHHGG